jgi:hypothetical protein
MHQRILQRVKRDFRRFFIAQPIPLVEPTLLPPTSEEQRLIDVLRADINSLPPLVETPTTNGKWLARLREIRHDILNRDPRNFLYWHNVAVTMYTDAPEQELTYLKKLPLWNSLEPTLHDEHIGNALPYKSMPETNGNIVHHAFHLSQLLARYDVDVSYLKNIFEFGGGYGNMARLIFKLGFKGTFVIFDLPEFIAIQKYFLSTLQLPGVTIVTKPTQTTTPTIVLLSNIEELKEQLEGQPIDLSIATWSLSESPIELREAIFKLCSASKYYLIGYQVFFGGMDNTLYFSNLVKKLNDYDWHDYEIRHLKGNHYLVGRKK